MPSTEPVSGRSGSRRTPPSRVLGVLLAAGAAGVCLDLAQGITDPTGELALGIASELTAFGILNVPAAARAINSSRFRSQRTFEQYTPDDFFPVELFFQRLELAERVVVMETYSFLLTDPDYRERFAKAISAAARRGAGVQILLLCPCSQAAADRATELGMPQGTFIRGIEHNLRELHLIRAALDPDSRRGVQVKLTASAPQSTGYRCDDMTLMSMRSPSRPSEEGQYIDLPADSEFLAPWNETFQELWHGGLSLEEHMLGELIVHADLAQRFEDVMFVQHQRKVFLAVEQTDRADVLFQATAITWRHGAVPAADFVSVPLHPDDDEGLLSVLDGHVEHKYGLERQCSFFRLDARITDVPLLANRPD